MPQWGNEWLRGKFFYPLQKRLVQLFYGPFPPQKSRMLGLPHPEPFGVMCSLPAANPSASLCPRAFTAPTHTVREYWCRPLPGTKPQPMHGYINTAALSPLTWVNSETWLQSVALGLVPVRALSFSGLQKVPKLRESSWKLLQ